MGNACISCGAIIPEGRLVCPICEGGRTEEMKMADNVKWVEINPVREKSCRPTQTNADRIRAMSDEELAHMFVRYNPEADIYIADNGEAYYDLASAAKAELEWLQQPVEGE